MKQDEKQKILILKSEENDFERCFSNAIRDEGIDSFQIYKPKISRRLFYAMVLVERLNLWPLYGLFLDDWKKRIGKYGLVVIFDFDFRPALLRWLKWKDPEMKRVVWLWNVFDDVTRYTKEECELVCTFDDEFARRTGFAHIDNFHFPKLFARIESSDRPQGIKSDVAYVGANKSRFVELHEIAEELQSRGITYDFVVTDTNEDRSSVRDDGIKVSSEFVGYESYLDGIMDSRSILELVKEGQSSSTLRVLEAAYFGKKLITNNENIKKSDLYKREDVFLIGEDDWNELSSFLDSPFAPIEESILNRYSFENWISGIYDLVIEKDGNQ